MSEPSGGQSGRVPAASTGRRRRGSIAVIAGIALAATLAAVASIRLIHPPPPGGLVAILSGPGGQATCSAAFSPDRATLAVGDCDRTLSGRPSRVYLRDVATRRWIATLASPQCPDASQVAFSPDGKTLAVFSGLNPTVCMWDLAARRETTLTDPGPRAQYGHEEAAGSFSPSGTTLAVASNGNIYLWDLASRHVTTIVPASGCSPACPIAFSPDGTILAVGQPQPGVAFGAEDIYLWDLATSRITATLTDHSAIYGQTLAVDSLAFSRNGILAAGDGLGRAYLWDAATRRLIATISPPINTAAGNASIDKGPADGGPYPAPGDFPHNVYVAFSPDGTTLAIDVDFGYGTYLYDVATRNRLATLTDPGGYFLAPSVVFSPDGTMLAVLDDGHTYLWSSPRPPLAP
jgi:WD40 repeat protein